MAATAALALSGCTSDSPGTGPGGPTVPVGSAVEVRFDGGSAMSTFSDVQVGRGASFSMPYVCATTDDPVRITGVELQSPDPGLEVTAWMVADEPGAPGAIVSRPLDQTPQARHASPEGLITVTCESGQAVQVWAEITLDREGTADAEGVRYRYTVDNPDSEAEQDEQVTEWVPAGVGLETS